jgi:hypothetical protein
MGSLLSSDLPNLLASKLPTAATDLAHLASSACSHLLCAPCGGQVNRPDPAILVATGVIGVNSFSPATATTTANTVN